MHEITFEELISVWRLKDDLEREKRNLSDLENFATSTTQKLTGMPQAKPLTYKTEKSAMLIVACKKRIEKITKALEQKRLDLWQRLIAQNLKNMQERVIICRYVYCMGIGDIAKELHVSTRYVGRLHKRGLSALGIE